MLTETGLSIAVSDLDFESFYPNVMRSCNISRMTLTFAPYEIEGRDQTDVRRYFSNLVSVSENATLLCSDFHGLPNYAEMEKLIEETDLL